MLFVNDLYIFHSLWVYVMVFNATFNNRVNNKLCYGYYNLNIMNGYSEHVLWGSCKKHIFVHDLAYVLYL